MDIPSNLKRCGTTAVALMLLVFSFANAAPSPMAIQWDNSSAGPDGPWNVILQAVDYPSQMLRMFPSLTQTTMFINATNCQASSASCPLPVEGMWQRSGAQATLRIHDSAPFDISSTWDNITGLLGMKGVGHYMYDRLQICGNCFMDGLAILSADDATINFPGGAQYRPDVGYLSMFARTNTFSYENSTGVQTTGNRTLSTAYFNKFIPSISFGLHVGSVYPNITPSLYWGGYDSSRLIGPPITSNNNSFTLRDISLTVSSGGGAYLNNSQNSTISVLQNPNPGQTLRVKPDPGPPYLYLPQSVCDAIATHLPVSFNKAFGLYTWDKSNAAYTSIISSPHSLTFSFDSAIAGSPLNINVPFALLNLTLDYPLASSPIQYFPCSPYTPSTSDSPYILGRAFLQAAFIGHAWDQQKLFLAQAPGPSVQSPQIQTISTSDVALANYLRNPTWEQTWALTLNALPGTFNNTISITSTSSPTSTNKKSGLSGGAIAGIVIGVIALIILILAALFFWRRRQSKKSKAGTEPQASDYEVPTAELADSGRVEKSTLPDAGNERNKYVHSVEGPPAELSATSPVARTY